MSRTSAPGPDERQRGWNACPDWLAKTLTFSRAPRGARIALVHANVPDKWHAMPQKGWQKYYWKPWKAY